MCTCNRRTTGSVCNPAGKNGSREYSKPGTTSAVAQCQDTLKGDDNVICFKDDDHEFRPCFNPIVIIVKNRSLE